MRLRPPTADHPSRALVSPADGGVDSAEVLIAPEKVLRALRIAADESHPAVNRLSYLRCARSEKGLQIVAVGFGETSETKPARWEDATTWWMEKGQKLGTATETDRVPDVTSPSVPGPNYSVGTKPLQSCKRSANDRGAHEPEPG